MLNQAKIRWFSGSFFAIICSGVVVKSLEVTHILQHLNDKHIGDILACDYDSDLLQNTWLSKKNASKSHSWSSYSI